MSNQARYCVIGEGTAGLAALKTLTDAGFVPNVSEPRAGCGWRVSLSDGAVRTYKGVIVANGHLWEQNILAVGTGFTGRSIHSGSYRNTSDIEGRVLVVGVGNSGCDLVVEAAQSRMNVTIAVPARPPTDVTRKVDSVARAAEVENRGSRRGAGARTVFPGTASLWTLSKCQLMQSDRRPCTLQQAGLIGGRLIRRTTVKEEWPR